MPTNWSKRKAIGDKKRKKKVHNNFPDIRVEGFSAGRHIHHEKPRSNGSLIVFVLVITSLLAMIWLAHHNRIKPSSAIKRADAVIVVQPTKVPTSVVIKKWRTKLPQTKVPCP